ncbi:TetR/AcrR family transcriptional regulator [Robertmurraya sp. DFI.2.37]|uniref:TetR/AcrR family transcriptional regulator n=1 Tax=Robertmurraya sp. DFI.2.37 TaxID=3031819 RepID=UPI0012450EB5|nr:TetR/AcrR family transcriptional regulator [Robertmurraya sp. DFI.2.37]MDF1511227.1 TetR/AcrR family transcriptional regulator [Robertmurraya sp. DFI.2.37]
MAPVVSEEYKRKKKREILDSALHCFAKKGFQTATIDDIVAHSKISKGAIYNYFKSKEEIYLALMNEETEAMNRLLSEKISTFQTALEKMQYLFDLYRNGNPYHAARFDSVVVHYEFRLFALRDVKLQQHLKERSNTFFIEIVTNILEEGKKTGEFKSYLHTEVAVNLFWALIDGAILQAVANKEFPYEEVIEQSKWMYLHQILSNPPVPSQVENRMGELEKTELFMDRIFLSLL